MAPAAKPQPPASLTAAADISKQLIALATGILGLTLTFWEKVLGSQASNTVAGLLVVAWCALAITIFFACWTLLAVTGTLAKIDLGEIKLATIAATANASNIRFPACVMTLAFITSFVLLGAAVVASPGFKRNAPQTPVSSAPTPSQPGGALGVADPGH